MLQYTKAIPLHLKDHPEFCEKWLQDRIAEDPAILGLGEVEVLARERRQFKAGRLDLLLAQPEEGRRFEVEIMLGPTDESHLIRTIEYWDIERRRYPGYDHVAVLVAEDITSRFLNVLALLSGTIPLMALQLSALEVSEQVVLHFARVLDMTSLRLDDESAPRLASTDRSYWTDRASPQSVGLADAFLEMINRELRPPLALNYNKFTIGLSDGMRSRNFVFFRPKKQFIHVLAEVSAKELWVERLEEAGISATVENRYVRLTVTGKDLRPHGELFAQLMDAAVTEFQRD